MELGTDIRTAPPESAPRGRLAIGRTPIRTCATKYPVVERGAVAAPRLRTTSVIRNDAPVCETEIEVSTRSGRSGASATALPVSTSSAAVARPERVDMTRRSIARAPGLWQLSDAARAHVGDVVAGERIAVADVYAIEGDLRSVPRPDRGGWARTDDDAVVVVDDGFRGTGPRGCDRGHAAGPAEQPSPIG